MRKRSTLRTRNVVAITSLVVVALMGAKAARGSETPLDASAELSTGSIVDRARGDVARVQVLVNEGSLPKNSLEEAQARLADVADLALINDTLFSTTRMSDLPPDQQAEMVAAAQRRFNRQAEIVCERQQMLDQGIVSQAEAKAADQEMETRRHVLQIARDRVRIEQQREMALEERNLERALEFGTSRKAMLKFDGQGLFNPLYDLAVISTEFEQQFHHLLPITARGQTMLHYSLGLNHRDKIDVGLNPAEPEGIWLRRYLEEHEIPYIAFRCAVPGSATAAHIHIGSGSSRITAQR